MNKQIEQLDEVTIRFAGDSGDGMQLSGTQFSNTAASMGNNVNTFPDYPSEIRAPEGTLYGVSAFQVHFGSTKINTPGDKIDVLVAMNASSLKVNLANLRKQGIIIVNSSGFNSKNLKLAKYDDSPLDNGLLSDYQLYNIDISSLVKQELKEMSLSPKDVERTKNLFALGLTYWLFNRPIEPTVNWLKQKFSKKPEILEANVRVLRAGWNFGQNDDQFVKQFNIQKSTLQPGTYRNITGNNAVALGLVAAARKANLPLFLGSYPITPASEILQYISGYKQYGVRHLQAEDEIGGITSAIGAAFGGNLAATTTSGPGLSLKIEAIGLAIMTELPLVIVNVQRAGPSTGLPTKPEQSDLFQSMYGRHGEAPLPVLAAATSSDCFDMTVEAARIALKYMTPVILLTDGYIAQGAEPWRVPKLNELSAIEAKFATNPENFAPYKRDPDTLARLWSIPGIQGMEHRIGGLEKEDGSGVVSHDPLNHQKMVEIRQKKIDNISRDIPNVLVEGESSGDLLIVGWGSSYGAIKTAFDRMRGQGLKVSYVHLKYLNPFPSNFGEILFNFKRILVPELNLGQLKTIIQSKYLVPVIGYNKVQGMPFKSYEIEEKVNELLNQNQGELS
ncbi:MAG: 2-oxoacid:acceptor oxidoreductase subunit alpha [Candidatus Cyclobacteriaceae bacterium M3_2C_046]